MVWSVCSIRGWKTPVTSSCGYGGNIIPGSKVYISKEVASVSSSLEGMCTVPPTLAEQKHGGVLLSETRTDRGSMNGEIRIWDVRAPEKPLYENLAQPLGLAGLAVHTGAPILATYVTPPDSDKFQRSEMPRS